MTTIVSSLAKKIEDPTTDANKTYSDRRSKEDKYSCSTPTIVGRICA